MKMKIFSTVDAKYFILDIVPVKESLTTAYEKLYVEDILNNDCFKYIDTTLDSFESLRIQFAFDISDGKNVYLAKFGACGYERAVCGDEIADSLDANKYFENQPFRYNIHLKMYPTMTKMSLVWDIGNMHTVNNSLGNLIPEQIINKQDGVVFDDYINLEIENGKVVNLSNREFFKSIEKIFC